MAARLPAELIRFGLVAVLGLGADLAVAWGLAVLAGLSLPLAATCGFATGAALNYVLHHSWTFRAAGPRAPEQRRVASHAARLLRYGLGLGLTLLARVATVALASRFLFAAEGQELPALLAGTLVSFIVNYLTSKHFVFQTRGTPPPCGPLPDIR
ncbi:GtrA family protein (plasmid) [Cereibacter azotoformans]|uniref:GtrA family protein n=1 Tax=Cereibacter azotoformans TaxID=43057 RepID=UPI001EEA55BC|nr:GtrA family protein [Cereibacter azotoformans]ULB12080.1 GtrA family protein [Cereibacter azotoformans]